MAIPTPRSRPISGLAGIRSLLNPADSTPSLEWSAERIKACTQIKALVVCCEHANCDSLPLRYGIHFSIDTFITLAIVKFLYVDSTNADRFHIDARFSLADGVEHLGRFIVGARRGFKDLVLITAWRHDARTETRLSEVMSALRVQGYLTPQVLMDLHPLYLAGTLRTHADLVRQLARKMSDQQIALMQSVVDEELVKTGKANAERDQALRNARRAEAVAIEASFIVDDLQNTNEALASRVEELEAERKSYLREEMYARTQDNATSLSEPDTLVEVLENQMYRGSSCTILIFGNDSRRYMKTVTFDRDGRVTAKAKLLFQQGRRVRLSSWDPVNQPGLWTRQGYFRNIYAAE